MNKQLLLAALTVALLFGAAVVFVGTNKSQNLELDNCSWHATQDTCEGTSDGCKWTAVCGSGSPFHDDSECPTTTKHTDCLAKSFCFMKSGCAAPAAQ